MSSKVWALISRPTTECFLFCCQYAHVLRVVIVKRKIVQNQTVLVMSTV